MHVIVWQFEIAPETASEFTAAYGPAGAWAQLFGKAQGYLGTELLRSGDSPNSYVTIDRWQNAEDFTRFQQQFRLEYQALDAACEALTTAERKLGVFIQVR